MHLTNEEMPSHRYGLSVMISTVEPSVHEEEKQVKEDMLTGTARFR